MNIECKGSLPSRKHFNEVQFSTIKRRSGRRESTPFLGLDPGEYKIKFFNETKEMTCLVKIWINPYGDAWQILKKLDNKHVIEDL